MLSPHTGVKAQVRRPRAGTLGGKQARTGARAVCVCVCVLSAWRVRVAVAGRQGLGGGIKGVMSWSLPDQPALASMALSHQLPTAGQPAPVAARVLACRLAGKGHAAGRSSPAGWAGVGAGSLRAPQGLGSPCPVP